MESEQLAWLADRIATLESASLIHSREIAAQYRLIADTQVDIERLQERVSLLADEIQILTARRRRKPR